MIEAILLAVALGPSIPAAAPEAGETPAVSPLERAHSHNDYQHRRPLLDALAQGFASVEADIFLVEGRLLVGHTRLDLRRERTLEALYLDPLRERVRKNKGQVFPGGKDFTLLIDLKTEAEATYKALHQVLEGYAEILTVARGGAARQGAVTVIVSGERPRSTLAAQPVRYAALDGRLADLESVEPASFIPLISDTWTRRFRWNGAGPMPEGERAELRRIVEKAHARGRRVRFWAAPDRREAWKELLAAGVDLINTDDLEGLGKFLREQAERRQRRV